MSAIFLSHSSKDESTADAVRHWLGDQGHRSVFLDFDPEVGIPAGRDWERELYLQLRACRAVIVMCSPHSMRSNWCFAEVTHARALGKTIFPLKVAECEIHPLLCTVQVIDLTRDFDGGLQRLGRGLKAAGLDPADTFDWDGRRAPYPGLPAFDEKDASVFFGRDNEIREGLDALRRQHSFGAAQFVLFLGASGSGKSSLLRAGIIPRLRRDPDHWIIISPFRPLEHPFNSMALALADSFQAEKEPRDWRTLHQRLRGAGGAQAICEFARELRFSIRRPDASLLLFIDQFEELFTLSDPAEADRYLTTLRAVAGEPSRLVMVVATMRSDFLAVMQAQAAIREMSFAQLLVNPMPVENIGQTIEGPAKVVGLEIETGLTQAMVQDTKAAGALPLLAFALRELWEQRTGNQLTISAYRDRLRGLSGSVAQAAEGVLASSNPMSPEEEIELRKAFLSLVRVDEEGRYVRRPSCWSEHPERIHPLLERFVKSRLLVSREQRATRILEVAHEALFRSWNRLTAWLNEDREFLLWRERLNTLLAEWKRNPNDPGTLLRGAVLTEAQSWFEQRTDQLSTDECNYISTSNDHRKREQQAIEEQREHEIAQARALAEERARATRRARIVAAVVVIAALGLGGIARYAWTKKMEAFSRELAASAALLHEHDVETSLRLSFEAFHVTPTTEAEISLRNALINYRESHMRTVFDWHQESVRWATFGPPSSNLVATASEDGTAALWNLEGGEPILRFSGGMKTEAEANRVIMYQVNFNPSGTVLVSASQDGRMRAWRIDTNEMMFDVSAVDVSEKPAALRGASFSHDGRYIVTAGEDRLVAIWDAETGKKLRELTGSRGHKDILYSAVFSPNDSLVATASRDGTIRVLNADSGELVRQLSTDGGKAFRNAVFNPEGTLMIGVGEGTKASLWETASWTLKGELGGHSQLVRSAAFSPDGNFIATASGDRNARIYEASTQKLIVEFATHKGSVNSVEFSPDGRYLLTGSGDNTARLWEIRPRIHHILLKGHSGPVRSVAFNPNGKLVATASEDGTATIWYTEKRGDQIFATVTHEKGWISGVSFSQDGTKFVTAGVDQTARIWDSRTARQLHVLRGHNAWVYFAAFSPDGRFVATVGRDGGPRIWNTEDGKNLGSCYGHRGRVTSVAFSKDIGEMRFATSGEDDTVRVWNWKSPVCEPAISIKTGHGWAYSVALSPDGKRIVTGGEDRIAKIWDIRSGSKLKELKGHDGWIYRVAWDGDNVVSASEDGTARVWDPNTGRQISVIPATAGWWVYSAEIASSGEKVALACEDGSAFVYGPEFLSEPSVFNTIAKGLRKLTPHERQVYLHEKTKTPH